MGISTSTFSPELTPLHDTKSPDPREQNKQKNVAEMIADIYKVGLLTYPKVFQCNNGSNFKAGVTKMLEKHRVKIWHTTTKYKHTHMAFIEALNFKVQDAQELNDPKKVSLIWVKHLYGLTDRLNNTETEITGMKPKNAIELKEVPLVNRENYPPKDTLPEEGLYHYLLQPGKYHNDQPKRAMDRIGSKGTYRLNKVVSSPGNWVMYYLAD